MEVRLIHSTESDRWVDILPILSLSRCEIYSAATGKISNILDIRIGWLFWEVVFSFQTGERDEDSIGIKA